MVATQLRSPSVTRPGLITSPAHRTERRSHGWQRRRQRWARKWPARLEVWSCAGLTRASIETRTKCEGRMAGSSPAMKASYLHRHLFQEALYFVSHVRDRMLDRVRCTEDALGAGTGIRCCARDLVQHGDEIVRAICGARNVVRDFAGHRILFLNCRGDC